MNIRQLINRFEVAESELSELISFTQTGLLNEDLVKLDSKLDKAYQQVLHAQLDSNEALLERIRFLISQIIRVSEDKTIAQRLCDKVIEDVKGLLEKESHRSASDFDETEDGADMIIEISYTIKATKAFTDEEIRQIGMEAQKSNERNEITGALCYDKFSGSIFQILEGPAQSIRKLMDSIQNDSRHKDIKVRFKGEITSRSYDRWSMFLVPVS